jgi:hypothetical protein
MAGAQGRGLFLTATARRGEVLFQVTGRERRDVYDKRMGVGRTWFGLGTGVWVAPARENPGRFLNHSCEPNVRLGPGLRVIATRALRPGEQVVVDYATTEEDPFWSMTCRCGSTRCRKVIRGTARFSG